MFWFSSSSSKPKNLQLTDCDLFRSTQFIYFLTLVTHLDIAVFPTNHLSRRPVSRHSLLRCQLAVILTQLIPPTKNKVTELSAIQKLGHCKYNSRLPIVFLYHYSCSSGVFVRACVLVVTSAIDAACCVVAVVLLPSGDVFHTSLPSCLSLLGFSADVSDT